MPAHPRNRHHGRPDGCHYYRTKTRETQFTRRAARRGSTRRPALRARRDAAGLAAPACAWRARIVALDIETDCGPLGSPAGWEPDDGAIRLVQVAGEVDGQVRCAVVDCYRVAPGRLLRLLADPEREIVAHNARYEQRWLAFHHGLPAWQRVLDTSVGYRVLERTGPRSTRAYEPQEATLAHVLQRVLGIGKDAFGTEWWGAPELPPAQLRYAAVDAAGLGALAVRVEGAGNRPWAAWEQVLAASRAACREAARRLPAGREALYAAMAELIGDGRRPARPRGRRARGAHRLAGPRGPAWRCATPSAASVRGCWPGRRSGQRKRGSGARMSTRSGSGR